MTSEKLQPRWKRVLLKLSGESFAGGNDFGIDAKALNRITDDIIQARETYDVEFAITVGGGNFWRGMAGAEGGIDRAQSDYMGMLAIVMNALALQDFFEQKGVYTRVQSSIRMPQIAEEYIRRRAIRHLEKGRIVIFAAGTGDPYFTSDNTAALRAVEIQADVLLKGTHSGVDGIYTADPKLDKNATKIDSLSYLDVINKDLRVMDTTAVTHAKENGLPIVVFDLMGDGNLMGLLSGESIGTIVK